MGDEVSRSSRSGAPTCGSGFIGLGSQGAPMARRIHQSGYQLTAMGPTVRVAEAFSD